MFLTSLLQLPLWTMPLIVLTSWSFLWLKGSETSPVYLSLEQPTWDHSNLHYNNQLIDIINICQGLIPRSVGFVRCLGRHRSLPSPKVWDWLSWGSGEFLVTRGKQVLLHPSPGKVWRATWGTARSQPPSCPAKVAQRLLQEHSSGYIKEKWLETFCMNVPVYQGQSRLTSMIAFCDKMAERVVEGRATQQGFRCFLPWYFCIKVRMLWSG